MHIYASLTKAKAAKQKQLAVLIDPDKVKLSSLDKTIRNAVDSNVDYFFIGGSLIVNNRLDQVLAMLRSSQIPLVLFPGSSFQLSDKADAILFLSLISGRNPELLIGNHVVAAPYLKASELEILPTGYMLIDGGTTTSVSYMSNTNPIPADKPEIALCTAMAGEMLGLKLLYLDAGSGAKRPVSAETISAVSMAVDIPLIVGGGIRTPEVANQSVKAGADLIVVGNAFEENPELIMDMSVAVHQENIKISTRQ
jgi:phosphoglycerol geranylgeranyltransferase